MSKQIYLDNAATTQMSDAVKQAMEPYLQENYGNASTAYSIGEDARRELEKSREVIAATLHAKTSEIYFTSGGSESDNWAVKNIAAACKKKGRHIITTNIEHHASLNSCEYLEKLGYDLGKAMQRRGWTDFAGTGNGCYKTGYNVDFCDVCQ